MGSVEDSHWFDMIIDEIGIALTKVDEESIQKSIELWVELTTKDIFDDQHTQDEDESWDDDDDYDDSEEDEDEDETTVSESCENMWELDWGNSTSIDIATWYHHYYEEDNGSSLKWKGGYQLLKDVNSSSKEDDESWDDDDEVEECYLEDIEEVMELFWKHKMSDVSNESLVCHDDEDDVSDKLQGFVDVRLEEIANNTEVGEVETLLPEFDWVYVMRD